MIFIPTLQAIWTLTETIKEIRMTITQLKAQVAELKSSTASAIHRITEDVDHLKAVIASGQVVTEADLTELSDSLATVKASLDAVDPDPSFPAPPPQVDPTA
jgi:uncharacterized protein YoxC